MSTQAAQQQLNSLDFGALIGGPMKALMDAQVYSATATINFIKKYGFSGPGAMLADSGGKGAGDVLSAMVGLKAAMVTFNYEKVDEESGKVIPYALHLPLLTMLPIPTLRITDATIDFQVKINVATSSSSESASSSAVSGGASVDVLFASGNASASYSTSQTDSSGQQMQSSYSMKFHIDVTSTETPPGIARLLAALETATNEQPDDGKSTENIRK